MTKNEADLRSKDKINIMVVEDELIVAKNIENQLHKMGYNVCALSDSGADAVSLAEKLKPDLVLMDIKLSGAIDGVEAAEQIHHRLQIPVVFLTAYADEETLERAKLTDPYGYIIKPFEPKRLSTTIDVALYKHKMEKKLRASELRFRTLASASPVGIFQTDTEGHCIYVNERWCEIAGLTPDEAQGDGWVKAIHPEDRSNIANAWYRMAHSGGKFAQEYRFQTPAGKITWVYGHAAPLNNEAGEKTGYIGTITDITRRKKLEDELLTSKKLESIGILAGGLAHDFNNLLSVILGNISMLKSDNNINKDQYNMLTSAEKAAVQAGELAHKLVVFSRGAWLDLEKITVSQLIQNTITENFPQNEELFDITVPDPIWPVNGDSHQLKKVLASLLLNAMEANIDNKTIKITAENIDSPWEELPLKKGQYVKMSVIDQGVGIPKELLGRIFDPYFTTKFRGARKGQGLSLSICYAILRKHDGYLSLTSEPGQGSRAEAYLPVYRETTTPTPSPGETLSPPCHGKILVMDDEETIRDVTGQMLERLGYEVEIKEEGQQIIDTVENAIKNGNAITAVILELFNTKGLGGKETLEKLIPLAPHVKAIAVTDFTDNQDRDSLIKTGFYEVLFKPFKLDELKKILEKIKKDEG